MDDVGAACGVTKLIVYRHFGSKEELYREILQQVFDDLGVELRAELAMPTHAGLGPRTLLTVAREDPAAFTLLWRHAAREPQFAAYAAELRSVSVSVVRQLSELDTGDELLDAWHSEALFGWLVETTLTWLERGDPARDDAFVEQTSAGFRALRTALTARAPPWSDSSSPFSADGGRIWVRVARRRGEESRWPHSYSCTAPCTAAGAGATSSAGWRNAATTSTGRPSPDRVIAGPASPRTWAWRRTSRTSRSCCGSRTCPRSIWCCTAMPAFSPARWPARAEERLASVVYLGAFVTAPGQSLLDVEPPEVAERYRRQVAEEGDGWFLPASDAFLEQWGIEDAAQRAWVGPRLTDFPFRCQIEPTEFDPGAARPAAQGLRGAHQSPVAQPRTVRRGGARRGLGDPRAPLRARHDARRAGCDRRSARGDRAGLSRR